jgi:energy-coupling factor transport system permease protein
MHPSSWIAWLTAITVFAFVVTNPLYIALALGAVVVVHVSFPAQATPIGRAVRLFVTFGLVLLVLRMVFVALLPNPGQTELFTLPELTSPRWLGGLELGGAVSAEVVVAAASEGLRLVVVLAAFGVFNAHADLSGLLRTVPAAFRDVGLVLSIAVAFVPGMLRTVADVRDAQRLRGEWGLRRLAPSLAVPVLGMSLERALLLAESMDVRGYGRGVVSRTSRAFLWGGLVLILASVASWISGGPGLASGLAIGGGAAIVLGFRAASADSPTTRLRGRPVRLFDVAIILAAGCVLVLVLTLGSDTFYNPFPEITWPVFAWPSAATTMLFTLPALAGADA